LVGELGKGLSKKVEAEVKRINNKENGWGPQLTPRLLFQIEIRMFGKVGRVRSPQEGKELGRKDDEAY